MAGAQGFPDWQRSSQAAVASIYSAFNIILAGTLDIGAIYTGPYSTLLTHMQAGFIAGLTFFTFDWYNDQALTDFVSSTLYACDQSTNYAALPVAAMWVDITLTPPGGAGQHCNLKVNGVAGAAPLSSRFTVDPQPIIDHGTVVAAGATVTKIAGTHCDGVADVAVTSTVAAFDVLVDQEITNGVWTTVACQSFTGTLGVLAAVPLLGYPVRTRVINRNAAAATITTTLTYRTA